MSVCEYRSGPCNAGLEAYRSSVIQSGQISDARSSYSHDAPRWRTDLDVREFDYPPKVFEDRDVWWRARVKAGE
jgi:hypothetical protein